MNLDHLEAEHALRELLARYCRAIDRHDWDALRAVFHPDSYDDHGAFYRGPGQGFADAAAEGLALYDRHLHSIANSLFRLDGDRATGETTFFAIAQTPAPDARHYQFGGRYLDRFERRGGEWRISNRCVVHDWLQISPLAKEADAALQAMGILGTPGPTDPSFSLTPELAHMFSRTAD